MNISPEDTMPDDAWKDSFDKLLDQRPILRELNVIKRDVRASFNMNSSYENSGCNNSGIAISNCEEQKKEALMNSTSPLSLNGYYLKVPESIKPKKKSQQSMKSKIISTPAKCNSSTVPFKCTLSPIGPWKLRHFNCNDKKVNTMKDSKFIFNATPIIENEIGNVEHVENLKTPNIEKETCPPRNSMGISPLELVREKWKSKKIGKQVCFATNDLYEKVEKIIEHFNQDVESTGETYSPKFVLQPGKWRKSLNYFRRCQNPIGDDTKLKSLERPKSMTNAVSVVGKRKSIFIHPNLNRTRTGSRSTYSLGGNDFKHQILQRCGQRRIITFMSAYNEDYLRNCCKIGEGAFGEVFVYSKPNQPRVKNKNDEKTVLKIIPIEGKELVNGEVQKTFEQILPEIIISMELGALNAKNRKRNTTCGFVKLQKVRCVKGQYPAYLQKLWEEYDLEKESENDHPKIFTNNQQYIILELAFSGKDLEAFHFKNAEQTFYALQQIILTLAVGEKEHQFEHRDLHWGNILVLNTNQQYITYKLEDNILTIPTKGIQITIIDYTLSRMTFNDYCFYNDLSTDEELFTASGDYQFEIYRMMRKVLNNKWETFEPKTNIFWISYVISKLIDGVTYKNIGSKNHLYYLGKLKELQASILMYKSCADYSEHVLL